MLHAPRRLPDPGGVADRRRGGAPGGGEGPPHADRRLAGGPGRAFPTRGCSIVGEGSERDALEAEAASLGVSERVVFTGRREDVPAVTAALDVAVLPSYREAQGLSVLEAMALSRPVVASNVGGIPEMIEDGVTRPARPARTTAMPWRARSSGC